MPRQYFIECHNDEECLAFMELKSDDDGAIEGHAAAFPHTRQEIVDQIEAWILDGYRLNRAEALAEVERFLGMPLTA